MNLKLKSAVSGVKLLLVGRKEMIDFSWHFQSSLIKSRLVTFSLVIHLS